MLSALSAGTILGLSAGFAPGPLLALVITQTLRHNAREGVKVALSPLITDLPIILLSLFLVGRLAGYHEMLGIVSFIGGIYVLYLAYESWSTGPVEVRSPQEKPKSLLKGSIINALNPHPYLFWLTVGGPFLLKELQTGWTSPILFLICFYVMLVGSKIGLALIVGRSRNFLASRYYIMIMRILAFCLALFAILSLFALAGVLLLRESPMIRAERK